MENCPSVRNRTQRTKIYPWKVGSNLVHTVTMSVAKPSSAQLLLVFLLATPSLGQIANMGAAFVCLLMLLLILRQAVCGSDVIELTALFSSSANSSCTELSCGLPVQHTPAAVLDGDPATWWQSEEQDEPVLLSLHSTHVR